MARKTGGSGALVFFPTSDTCVWTRHPVGEQVEACIDGSWLVGPAARFSHAPLPSPLPTLAKDSRLSCLSFMERPDQQTPSVTEATPPVPSQELTVFPGKTVECQKTDQQTHLHSEFLAPRKTPMAEKATNTGASLLSLGVLGSQDTAWQVPGETVVQQEEVCVSSVSINTQSSLDTPGSLKLDLCSFAASSYQSRSGAVSTLSEDTLVDSQDGRDFYQKMLASVQELLQTPVEKDTKEERYFQAIPTPELSLLPIPHITSITSCSESTLDETAHAADMITLKYVGGLDSDTTLSQCQHTTGADSYLPRHEQPRGHILDLGRLRTLPKLL